jgi:hypothetical protein
VGLDDERIAPAFFVVGRIVQEPFDHRPIGALPLDALLPAEAELARVTLGDVRDLPRGGARERVDPDLAGVRRLVHH